MFKVGDKVVPNGFRADGVHYKYGDNEIKSKWEKESKVVTVDSIDEDGCISATDGSDGFHYHQSELRIATEKEIKALNEAEEQKFEFDFDNYFYVLELNDSKRFIITCNDFRGEFFGINENNSAFLDKEDIKKIIAIIPKR